MDEYSDLQLAITCLEQGGIIAYPTEAVYGLGCDPFNEVAVRKLLTLKHREIAKGLILIASRFSQIASLVLPLTDRQHQQIQSQQQPITWLLPANQKAPQWITGGYQSIAIRLTQHPIAYQLCESFHKPIVSTSANIAGAAPARTALQVMEYFPNQIDYLVSGEVGSLTNPTPIRCVVTGEWLRK